MTIQNKNIIKISDECGVGGDEYKKPKKGEVGY